MSAICFQVVCQKKYREVKQCNKILIIGDCSWRDLQRFIALVFQFSTDFKSFHGTSLVAQWLRIHLPMQGTWVQALVQEDPTCRGATKSVATKPQLLSPSATTTEARAPRACAPQQKATAMRSPRTIYPEKTIIQKESWFKFQ